MDRRVLFATLILFAGGATGVGVAAFAFVDVGSTTADATVVWESAPAEGGDGSGVAVATVDGNPLLLQPAVEDGSRVVRATVAGEDEPAWTAPVTGPDADPGGGDSETDGDASGGDDPVPVSALATGTLDGDPVVALTTEPGALVVVDATDGSRRFAVDLGGPGGLSPAVGDLTGDGTAEVAAVATDGSVRAVDAAGEPVFERSLAGDAERGPLLVGPDGTDGGEGERADGDGGSDDGAARGLAVLTTAGDPGTVRLLDGAGETRWTTTTGVRPLSWNAVDTPDGPVIALGGASGSFETVEASDGTVRYEIGLQDRPVSVGDAGPGRIYVGGSGSVWAVDLLDGEVVWKQQYGASTRINEPRVGAVAGRGPGPVVVNRAGEFLAMSRTGEVVARGDAGDVVAYGGPLFADATGDGDDEVIVVADDGSAVALAT